MLWTTIGLVTKCAIHKNEVVIYTFIIIIIKLTVVPHNNEYCLYLFCTGSLLIILYVPFLDAG